MKSIFFHFDAVAVFVVGISLMCCVFIEIFCFICVFMFLTRNFYMGSVKLNARAHFKPKIIVQLFKAGQSLVSRVKACAYFVFNTYLYILLLLLLLLLQCIRFDLKCNSIRTWNMCTWYKYHVYICSLVGSLAIARDNPLFTRFPFGAYFARISMPSIQWIF